MVVSSSSSSLRNRKMLPRWFRFSFMVLDTELPFYHLCRVLCLSEPEVNTRLLLFSFKHISNSMAFSFILRKVLNKKKKKNLNHMQSIFFFLSNAYHNHSLRMTFFFRWNRWANINGQLLCYLSKQFVCTQFFFSFPCPALPSVLKLNVILEILFNAFLSGIHFTVEPLNYMFELNK